jgi:hypothetical protein
MLNQDALVNADAIEALVEFLETHPHSGIAGPNATSRPPQTAGAR